MNWNQYFKLREKQKKRFWAFFVILVLLHLFFIRSSITEKDSICKGVNVVCDVEAADGSESQDNVEEEEEGLEEAVGEAVVEAEETFDNLTNLTLNENTVLDENKELDENKKTESEKIETKEKLHEIALSYVWPDCKFECGLTKENQVELWAQRVIYTPLFMLHCALLAYILSLAIFLRAYYKEYRNKDKKENAGNKEEPVKK